MHLWKPLAPLFQKNVHGKIQRWDIEVNELEDGTAEIVTSWGQVDGAIQKTRDRITEGKNIGKKTETTALQQALKEAKALWTKQKKSGYVETPEQAMAGTVDADVIKGGIDPMLAARYDEHGDDIVWPAFTQPKLDGHRCIAVVKDGKCTLWSRTRKPITSVPHIVEAIERQCVNRQTFGGKDTILDGELYNHDLHEDFEKLTSALRKKEPVPEGRIVQYHIYDLPSMADHGFAERHDVLKSYLEDAPPELVLVQTEVVQDEDDAMHYFDVFTSMGYEGSMLRNAEGVYENKRSRHLQKVKEFVDAEFKIVGVGEGRGKLAGHAIFECETSDGKTFGAKMKGETSKLKEIFDKANEYIGQMLTVKYQNLTKAGIPRFPVGLRVRKDI